MSLAIPAEELGRSQIHIKLSPSGGLPVFRLEPLPSTTSTVNVSRFNVNFHIFKEGSDYNIVVYPSFATTPKPDEGQVAPRPWQSNSMDTPCQSIHTSASPLRSPPSDVSHTDAANIFPDQAASSTQCISPAQRTSVPLDRVDPLIQGGFNQQDISGIFGDMMSDSSYTDSFHPAMGDARLYIPTLDFSDESFHGDSRRLYMNGSENLGFNEHQPGTRCSSIAMSESVPTGVVDQHPSTPCLPSPSTSTSSPSPRLSPPLFTTAPEVPLRSKARGTSDDSKSTSKGLRRAGKRQYPCLHPTCSRFFTSEYTRRMHMASHDAKPRKTYPCSMREETGCRETFSRAHDRLRHEVAMHGKDCQWVCEKCGRFFSSNRMLDVHKCPGIVSGWLRARHPSAAVSEEKHGKPMR